LKFRLFTGILDSMPALEIDPPMVHFGTHTISWEGNIYVRESDSERAREGVIHFRMSEHHWEIPRESVTQVID